MDLDYIETRELRARLSSQFQSIHEPATPYQFYTAPNAVVQKLQKRCLQTNTKSSRIFCNETVAVNVTMVTSPHGGR